MKKVSRCIVDMLYSIRRSKKIQINAFDMENKHLLIDEVTIGINHITLKTLPWGRISNIRAIVSKNRSHINPLLNKLFEIDGKYYQFTSMVVDTMLRGNDQYYTITLGYTAHHHIMLYFDSILEDVIYEIMSRLNTDTIINFIDNVKVDCGTFLRLLFPMIYSQLKHIIITKEILISFLHMSKVSDMKIEFKSPCSSIIRYKTYSSNIESALNLLNDVNVIAYLI